MNKFLAAATRAFDTIKPARKPSGDGAVAPASGDTELDLAVLSRENLEAALEAERQDLLSDVFSARRSVDAHKSDEAIDNRPRIISLIDRPEATDRSERS